MIEWKEINNYIGYSISNTGIIRNNKTGKILKQSVSNVGYKFVCIKPYGKYGKSINLYLHKEVAVAFVENPENKQTVNHKDGNKTNNLAENLEWATQSEQLIHAFKKNLVKIPRGECRPNSKLTELQIHEILSNPQISGVDFSDKFGVSNRTISDIKRGKRWKHIFSLYKSK